MNDLELKDLKRTDMKKEPIIKKKDLKYVEYLNRENNFSHRPHNEDMAQYEYLKAGNPKALDEIRKMFNPDIQGHLSENPIRNIKYLFVASTTLACRSAISGGMPSEDAYNASDLYIQKMDLLSSIDEVKALAYDMFSFYTEYMANLDKQNVISKNISVVLEYIRYHLHEKIQVEKLAEIANLNPNYLSVLFKKEIGVTISQYISNLRVDTAANMLKYSDYSYGEISAILAFSSQSHFISVFSKRTGMTPKEYRMYHYDTTSIEKNSSPMAPTWR